MKPGTKFEFALDGRLIKAEVVSVDAPGPAVTFPYVEQWASFICAYPSENSCTWRIFHEGSSEWDSLWCGPSSASWIKDYGITIITGPDRDRILAACAAGADPEGFEWWPRVFVESGNENLSVHLDASTRVYVRRIGGCEPRMQTCQSPLDDSKSVVLTEIDSRDLRFAPAVERARAWVAEQKKPTLAPKPGIAAVYGKWPGDESDEQIQAALKSMDASATPAPKLRTVDEVVVATTSAWLKEFGGERSLWTHLKESIDARDAEWRAHLSQLGIKETTLTERKARMDAAATTNAAYAAHDAALAKEPPQ